MLVVASNWERWWGGGGGGGFFAGKNFFSSLVWACFVFFWGGGGGEDEKRVFFECAPCKIFYGSFSLLWRMILEITQTPPLQKSNGFTSKEIMARPLWWPETLRDELYWSWILLEALCNLVRRKLTKIVIFAEFLCNIRTKLHTYSTLTCRTTGL